MNNFHPNEHIIYSEKSQRSFSAGGILFIFFALLFCAIGYTTYQSISVGHIFLSEYFIEVFILLVMIKQAFNSYTFYLTDDAFIISENGLLRHKEMVLPYRLIDGVYTFHQELMGQLKFRYKYRKLSSLDPRKVWALAYAVEAGKKIKHGRLLIKAEDEFFQKLNEKIPGRVCVPQEEVVFYALLRQDAVKHGEDVDEYLAKIKAQQEDNDDVTTNTNKTEEDNN